MSILFADLVGFTPLSETRDPEDARELLSRYFESTRTTIERHGGTVEKFIGDAVMAVWGTPTAQEDDADRAVRAALELVPAVALLGDEAGASGLRARAAVLTGEAAATIGADGQGMVAGDLVNTASRVQMLAEPGTVLVGEATRRATEASIAYDEAGAHALKGKAEPLPLWRALRVTAGRGGGLRPETLEPPFVGRDRELRLLKELFHASGDDRKAHLVSIVGLAGIGKSRLAWELQKYLDGVARAMYWHRGRCLAYGDGVSFWALAEMVRMRAGIAEGEDPPSARVKLRSMLGVHVAEEHEREWIEPRLAQLLALDDRDEGELPDLFAGWRLFLERMAEENPVVLVFEDMQWADTPLLDFVDHVLDWSRHHPIFVLALTRPELGDHHPQWASGRNSTTLALEPLATGTMEILLEGFVPGLPDDLRSRVLDRAEGIPLYAVETVRMLLDRGLLQRDGEAYRPTRTIEALDVPETLHSLVAARLDGLAPGERRLLQDASVLGKTFMRTSLAAATAFAEDELDRLLGALVRKEILSLRADPRSPERGQYGFVQDLLRQIAYETMPRGERKTRHLAAAAYLEREWGEGEHEAAEIVASHYLTSLDLDPDGDDAAAIKAKASETLVAAAERAASLAAGENAQRYFERAIELTDSGLERAQLHERAGRAAMTVARAEPARKHLEEAIAGFGELGLTHAAARVQAQLGIVAWIREGDIAGAVEVMERSLGVLADEEHDADFATLSAQLARVLYFSGRVDDALERNEDALQLAESLQLPEVLSHGLNTKGVILWGYGRREEAQLLLRHALQVALAADLSDAALRAYHNLISTTGFRDRYREALELVRAGADLARRVGDRERELTFRGFRIVNLVDLGEWDEALAAEEAIEPGFRFPVFQRMFRLEVFLHRGELEEARRRIEAARDVGDLNELQSRAGLRWAESRLLLAEGRAPDALVAAEEAIAFETATGDAWLRSGLQAALEAALAAGDEGKLDELIGRIESLPPGELTPFRRGLGARFSARRAAVRGDEETALAGFVAAALIYREIERSFDLAVVQLEHAEWLAAAGRAGEAEPLLGEAREIFERLRATPWLERLARAGSGAAEPALTE